jgi:signal recognition particle-docking protein FtsY/non-canonical purine NTP pyrophosphatase (RdgB/HAM1 family)
MNFFSKIFSGLSKTRNSIFGGLSKLFNSFTKIDEELFENLEETLILSDIGVETSVLICDRLRKKVKEDGITDPTLILGLIQEIITEIMGEDLPLDLSPAPAVIMVIGVNGAGKTTTIGKLAKNLKNDGKSVVLCAADTFRAAAIDQLQIWADRAGVPLVRKDEGSDPASVIFDGIKVAKETGADVLICDTAGRLHNKKNLMDELAKMSRIIERECAESSKEVLLVLDATTGQNAVNQAKLFSEVAPITGIVLTKLDGTAKGGIVIAIKNELGLPVKLIGVGEKIDDLLPFDSKSFVAALFDSADNTDGKSVHNYDVVAEDNDAVSTEEESSGEEFESETGDADFANENGENEKSDTNENSVILATNNAHKLKEFREILEPLGYTVLPMPEGIEFEETGDTFAENAFIKANVVHEETHMAVIADDSGLCVDYLNGKPGVHSHRYGGEELDDTGRYEFLLSELSGVKKKNRKAHFECVICYISAAGEAKYFTGICDGTIAEKPSGAGGFGYDPIFSVQTGLFSSKTFSELTADEKNKISHRGKAVNSLIKDFKK